MAKEVSMKTNDVSIIVCSPSEVASATCRVCLCAESDQMGDAALGFLGIISPSNSVNNSAQDMKLKRENFSEDGGECSFRTNSTKKFVVEFDRPKGDVSDSHTNVELGFSENVNELLELGCACKDDLAQVHYACALKWFVNRASTVCEICHHGAKNIKTSDIEKVKNALKEYEVIRKKIKNGEPLQTLVRQKSGMDPDAVAIWRQRLVEVSHWFNPNNYMSASFVYNVDEQPSTVEDQQPSTDEDLAHGLNTAANWVAHGTVILLATRLLFVTLAWLIAPSDRESNVKNGLYIILGGSAFTVVLFFRFCVFSRIKFGRTQFWVILLALWCFEICYFGSTTEGENATLSARW